MYWLWSANPPSSLCLSQEADIECLSSPNESSVEALVKCRSYDGHLIVAYPSAGTAWLLSEKDFQVIQKVKISNSVIPFTKYNVSLSKENELKVVPESEPPSHNYRAYLQMTDRLYIIIGKGKFELTSIAVTLFSDDCDLDNFRLCWSQDCRFLFLLHRNTDQSITVSKYNVLIAASVSNSCSLPSALHSDRQVFVSRVPFMSDWMFLNGWDLWEVVDSPIDVKLVGISPDEMCLAVTDHSSLVLCDFARRIWRRLRHSNAAMWIKSLKWLDTQVCLAHIKRPSRSFDELLLIFRDGSLAFEDCLIIELEAEYNGNLAMACFDGKLLLALPAASSVNTLPSTILLSYAFNFNDLNAFCVLAERIEVPFAISGRLIKQMARIDNLVYMLDDEDELTIGALNRLDQSAACVDGNVRKYLDVSGFLFLDQERKLIACVNSSRKSVAVLNSSLSFELDGAAIIGLYPQIEGCLMVAMMGTLPSVNSFSPRQQQIVKPLLPKLLSLNQQMIATQQIGVLILEYILLDAEPAIIKWVDTLNLPHWPAALAAHCRKIEVSDATKLLQSLSIQIGNVVDALNVREGVNFLPYVANSYTEDRDGRLQACKCIIERALALPDFWAEVPGMLTLVSTVADLHSAVIQAIQSHAVGFWSKGLIGFAFEFIEAVGCPVALPAIDLTSEPILVAVACDLMRLKFRALEESLLAWIGNDPTHAALHQSCMSFLGKGDPAISTGTVNQIAAIINQ